MSALTRKRTILSSGWQYKLADSNGLATAESNPKLREWAAVSTFPSVVQLELLNRKLIPDPNVGENERLIQWVGEADWEYRCCFPSPSKQSASDSCFADLLFEGLDTFATVMLNGRVILQSDNMFLPQRVDVKGALKESGSEDNALVILFESAVKKGRELEEKYGARKSMMRDKKRMQMRKAQYHWGWDWGPIIVTSGPYLPIHLEVYWARIDNLHVTSNISSDHSSADLEIEVNLAPSAPPSCTVQVEILNDKEHVISKATLYIRDAIPGKANIHLQNPKLWWPYGQGEQSLYKARATLQTNERVTLDVSTTQFGIRSITVIQRPLDNEPGKTFMFNVNGRDIFIQGGDWIPADNLLPRIKREKYFGWMEFAQKSNLNMIRVWGGGIYEPEDFWDACDQAGMLVWHDYAFACGDYPTHKAFLDSVRREAEVQTTRFRNRASLAVLCGGNEDFMLADWADESLGLEKIEYDHHDTKGPFDNQSFPQRTIYLDLLPKVAEVLCPEIFYWPNSPWGGDLANDPTVGDIHQWNVWHARQLSYQRYNELSGRFVSEFGMHGFPVMQTVDVFAPKTNPEDRHPQSKAIDSHNKGHGAETRIARYLAENIRYSQKLEDFAYASQLVQSEAYGYALRDWKRKFRGKGKELCAGAIIWQFNDVYPCTSWAFVDYYLRPKPAFYAISRSFAPISIGIERRPWSRWIDDDRPRETEIPRFSIFAHNTTPSTFKGLLQLKAYDFHAGKYIPFPGDERKPITLAPGQNTELGEVENPDCLTEESLIILSAAILDPANGNDVVARIMNWPEPYRYLTWPKDTQVSITVTKKKQISISGSSGCGEKDVDEVKIIANQPCKGLFLSVEGDDEGTEEPEWDDNMVDLMPEEELRIGVSGLKGRKVRARFLAAWEVDDAVRYVEE